MLNKFVAVYVPSSKHERFGDDVRLDSLAHEQIAAGVAGEFAESFGGATVLPARGYWKSESGELVEESILIVKSYHDTDSALEVATRIARGLAVELNQESVTIESNDGVDFIGQESPSLPELPFIIDSELVRRDVLAIQGSPEFLAIQSRVNQLRESARVQ